MTSDGGVRYFGRALEAYFVSNIPRIAAFVYKNIANFISKNILNCNAITCDVS